MSEYVVSISFVRSYVLLCFAVELDFVFVFRSFNRSIQFRFFSFHFVSICLLWDSWKAQWVGPSDLLCQKMGKFIASLHKQTSRYNSIWLEESQPSAPEALQYALKGMNCVEMLLIPRPHLHSSEATELASISLLEMREDCMLHHHKKNETANMLKWFENSSVLVWEL